MLFAVAETTARIIYVEQIKNACSVPDPVLGHRFLPDCTAMTKTAEGPWVSNSYNSCGYRSPQSCGPVPANTRRVALIGSSISEGFMVAYENTVAGRLATDLTAQCHAPVDVQNLGYLEEKGDRLMLGMDAALKLRPQAVLLLVMTNDVNLDDEMPEEAAKVENGPQVSLLHRLAPLLRSSRAVKVAQGLLFRNASIFTSIYLLNGDRADYLRPPFSPIWQQRLADFDDRIGRLAKRASDAGVPFVLTYVPQQAQAALLVQHDLPKGVDPLALGKAIGEIAARHGIIYHDASMEFRTLPDPIKLFYHVDGHVNGEGYPIIAAALASEFALTIPAFSTCAGSSTVATRTHQ